MTPITDIDIVDQLRESRKNPLVLHHQVITLRSNKPDLTVLIFEGKEDLGVYETWISRCTAKFIYESIPGKGKEQLLNFRNYLIQNHKDLINGIYFFVDNDFDVKIENEDDLFCLNAYSIENILCCEESLDSILRDEFMCTGNPLEREAIIKIFNELIINFQDSCCEINFRLFAARRKKIDVIAKPSSTKDFCSIGVDSIALKAFTLNELVELKEEINITDIKSLKEEFDLLDKTFAQRGKYVLCFFKHWIEQLTLDKNHRYLNYLIPQILNFQESRGILNYDG